MADDDAPSRPRRRAPAAAARSRSRNGPASSCSRSAPRRLLRSGSTPSSGRRFVVGQINALETASGLKIHVGRIEGSVFGGLTLRDITPRRSAGHLLHRAARPMSTGGRFAYFRSHIDIRALDIPSARLYRLPALRPGDPNAPLLPDIDLDIGRLHVGRLLDRSGGDRPAPPARARRPGQDRRRPRPGRPRRRRASPRPASPAATGCSSASTRCPRRTGSTSAVSVAGAGRRLRRRPDRHSTSRSTPRIGGQRRLGELAGPRAGDARRQGASPISRSPARNGTFTVNGPAPARPDARRGRPAAAAPLVQVNLDRRARPSPRRHPPAADSRRRSRSRAEGLVDLGQNQLRGLQRRRAAAAARARSRPISAAATSGSRWSSTAPSRRPSVAYDLQRRQRSTFGGTTVEGLQARGRAHGATPTRSSSRSRRGRAGSPASTRSPAALLANVTPGRPARRLSGTRLVSDNMRLRSDRINARLALAFDLAARPLSARRSRAG